MCAYSYISHPPTIVGWYTLFTSRTFDGWQWAIKPNQKTLSDGTILTQIIILTQEIKIPHKCGIFNKSRL